MDIQFHGANCITLASKHARVTIDDNLADVGAKSISKPDDVVLYTGPHADPAATPRIMIDQPGEYEVAGVSIYGIAARSHMDEEKQRSSTIYKLVIDDLRILVTGHIYPELTDAQLETIGMVDVMVVPVGGNGYTLDSIGALKLIKKVEPKVVVPTHYELPNIDYTVPQQSLEQALKGLSMEPKETVAKLRIKAGELGDVMQLMVLERS